MIWCKQTKCNAKWILLEFFAAKFWITRDKKKEMREESQKYFTIFYKRRWIVGLAGFYANGLSFKVIKSLYFWETIEHVCENSLSGHVPPTYNWLRNTLLQNGESKADILLKPIKQSRSHKRISYVSNGWTDTNRNRSVINSFERL